MSAGNGGMWRWEGESYETAPDVERAVAAQLEEALQLRQKLEGRAVAVAFAVAPDGTRWDIVVHVSLREAT